MTYSLKLKNKAKKLRRVGNSLSFIAKKLQISKSTISVWVSNVNLDSEALKKIDSKRIAGQQKANLVKSRTKEKIQSKLMLNVKKLVEGIPVSIEYLKIICAVLFWTEGSKSGSFVSFINSDPKMIELFLYTLRKSFDIDEDKLRGLVHVHEYHDEVEIKEYWSKVSDINLGQFTKSYKKPHTGKRKREGYLGSFRIRYYDVTVARELTAIYTMLPEVLK